MNNQAEKPSAIKYGQRERERERERGGTDADGESDREGGGQAGRMEGRMEDRQAAVMQSAIFLSDGRRRRELIPANIEDAPIPIAQSSPIAPLPK